MAPEQRIKVLLSLTGDGVTPSSVNASVVGKVLRLFERLVLALASPDVAETEDEDGEPLRGGRGPAPVALVDVLTGSDALVIELDAAGDGPCRMINEARNRPESIEEWSPRARKAYVDLTRYVTIEGEMGLELQGHDSYALAAVRHEVPERYRSGTPPLLQGPTTVIAVLKSVGDPTRLQVPRRRRPLTVVLNAEQVQAVKNCVTERVRVDGVATWDPVTLEMRSMDVRSIAPLVAPDLRSAFRRLQEVSAGLWDEVDPTEYVRSMREEQ